MFPFKIRFSRKLRVTVHESTTGDILDIAGKVISIQGADYFSRRNNRLEFENRIFNRPPDWRFNIMKGTDAGFVKVTVLNESKVKITDKIIN